MAERKTTFLIKRSNVPGKVPSAGDLLLGELALNTADVILYASGTTVNDILPIGWDRVSRTGDTMTGPLIINSDLTVNGNISLKTNTITAITDTILSASTNYEIPTTKAVYDYITNNNFNKITVTFDGCYTYIPTNTMAKTMADGNYNIIAWKIVGNNQTNSGCTASIDVLINGVSAVGSGNKPSLTNATANYATISGWTTTVINENDIIGLNIASNNDATYLNVVIITRKNN